jgi:hypothetical protein
MQVDDMPPGVEEDCADSLAACAATFFLGADVGAKVTASLLQGTFLHWHLCNPLLSFPDMFFVFAGLSFATVLLAICFLIEPEMSQTILEQSQQGPGESGEISLPAIQGTTTANMAKGTLRSALILWCRPQLWFLSATNFAFGLCSGYMNGVVNDDFASQSAVFGEASLGTLVAITSLIAAVSAAVFGMLSPLVGHGLLLSLGSIAFASIPCAVFLGCPNSGNQFWGVGLLSLYVCQGIGRGVYEGTNRAVFAAFFQEAEAAPAFANCMLQSGTASFVSFLLQSLGDDRRLLLAMILMFSCCILPGHALARCIK